MGISKISQFAKLSYILSLWIVVVFFWYFTPFQVFTVYPPLPYNASPFISIIIFHIFRIFHISNFTFFKLSILPIFLIYFTFPMFPIFWYFSDFLFPSFHTSNFCNSPFSFHSLSYTNNSLLSSSFIPSLVSYFILPHFTTFPNFTSFPPHFTIFPNFPNITSSVSLQLCSFNFISQLYTLSSLFRHIFSVMSRPWSCMFPVQLFQFYISAYFISSNHSSFRHFFPFKNFLYTMPHSRSRNRVFE